MLGEAYVVPFLKHNGLAWTNRAQSPFTDRTPLLIKHQTPATTQGPAGQATGHRMLVTVFRGAMRLPLPLAHTVEPVPHMNLVHVALKTFLGRDALRLG